MSRKIILGTTRPLVAPGCRLGFQEFNGNEGIKFSMDSRVLHNYRPRIQSLRYAACVEVINVRREYDFWGLDWGD